MHSNCILDSVANLLVRHMVFVGNIQKSPIASHLKGLDLSLDFCCQGPAFIDIKESMSVCISLTLEASEMFFFVPPYDLQSRKSCCCLGYPGKNLGF